MSGKRVETGGMSLKGVCDDLPETRLGIWKEGSLKVYYFWEGAIYLVWGFMARVNKSKSIICFVVGWLAPISHIQMAY